MFSSQLSKKKKALVSNISRDINTLTVAYCALPAWCQLACKIPEYLTRDSIKLVQVALPENMIFAGYGDIGFPSQERLFVRIYANLKYQP